jgi:tetratricopeptide (TPR) repeat protein
VQAIDIRFGLRWALAASGHREQSVQPLREAEALARLLGDRRREALALSTLATHYWGAAEYGDAIDAGRRALELANALDDQDLRVTTDMVLARVYYALGQYARADDYLHDSLVAASDASPLESFGLPYVPGVGVRVFLAWCAAERGQFDTAQTLREEGLRIARAVDSPWSLIVANWGSGYCFLLQGKTDQAVGALEAAVQACETGRIPLLFPNSAALLGAAYVLARRTRDARALLQRTLEQIMVIGNSVYRISCTLALGEAYLVDGERDRAGALACEALRLSEVQDAKGDEARALRLLGEIAASAEPPEGAEAEGYYRQALALAEELGMRPLVAHCHLGLGTLYENVGREQEARGELTTAIGMYRAMDMPFWLARAEAIPRRA